MFIKGFEKFIYYYDLIKSIKLKDFYKILIFIFYKKLSIQKEITIQFKDAKLKLIPGSGEISTYNFIFHRSHYTAFPSFFPKEDFTIFDIGANIGCYSIFCALYNKTGKIFSFEPNPDAFKRLSWNIEMNNIKNIFTYNIGFWDESKTGFINVNKSSTLGRVEDTGSIQVVLKTLDDFVSENNIKNIDILKIDAEFAEKNILLGGKNSLSIVKRIICEIHDKKCIKDIKELLNFYNFNLIGISNSIFYFKKDETK